MTGLLQAVEHSHLCVYQEFLLEPMSDAPVPYIKGRSVDAFPKHSPVQLKHL